MFPPLTAPSQLTARQGNNQRMKRGREKLMVQKFLETLVLLAQRRRSTVLDGTTKEQAINALFNILNPNT